MQVYPQIEKLKDGRYTFKNQDGTLWSDIYGENGIFDEVGTFNENYACVKTNDGWTFVGTNGKLMDLRFKQVKNFSEGFACVRMQDGWTFIDNSGKIIKFKFNNSYILQQDYLRVKKDNNYPRKREVYVDYKFKMVDSFKDGFARVQLKDGWTFVDYKGNVMNFRFENVSNFHKGLAQVILFAGKVRYLDKFQNSWERSDYNIFKKIYDEPLYLFEVNETKTNDIKFFKTALSILKQKFADMKNEEMDNEKIKALKKDIDIKLKQKFKNIMLQIKQERNVSDFTRLKVDDGWTYIDKQGNLIGRKFESVGPFKCGFSYVKCEDGYTYIDKQGNLMPIRFASANDFSKGLAKVRLLSGETKYLDKYQNLWDMIDYNEFEKIYLDPEYLFKIDDIKIYDVKFFKTALSVIKQKYKDLKNQKVSSEQIEEQMERLNSKIKKEFSHMIACIKQNSQNDDFHQ